MRDFRDLYNELIAYQGEQPYQDILLPFIPDAMECMKAIKKLSYLHTSLPGNVPDEILWSLFALNVCNDDLLSGLNISKGEYLEFFTKIGFTPVPPGKIFNPLIHEIVEVGNWPAREEGVSLGRCYWPGLRYGELVFSRCAVDVFCHPDYINERISNQSILYFTNHRMRKKVHDCSHGWGNNSRWRTSFHRNYELGDYIFLNIDGKYDLTSDGFSKDQDPGLLLDQARELLFNRSFVLTDKGDEEYFPYDWRMALKKQPGMWPLKPEMIIPTETALETLKTEPDI